MICVCLCVHRCACIKCEWDPERQGDKTKESRNKSTEKCNSKLT